MIRLANAWWHKILALYQTKLSLVNDYFVVRKTDNNSHYIYIYIYIYIYAYIYTNINTHTHTHIHTDTHTHTHTHTLWM